MKLIKADNYQTWYIENFDKSIIIDPWLTNKLQPKGSFFIQRKKANNTIRNRYFEIIHLNTPLEI